MVSRVCVLSLMVLALACGGRGEADTQTPRASTPTEENTTPSPGAQGCGEGEPSKGDFICETCIDSFCGEDYFNVYGEDFPGAPDGLCRVYLDCVDACPCGDDLCNVECAFNRDRPCTQAMVSLDTCQETYCTDACFVEPGTPEPDLWCEAVDDTLTAFNPIESQLTAESPKDGVVGGTPYARYSIDIERGRKIQIDMTSSDFDTYLVLLDSRCGLVTLTDEGAGGSDARLSYAPVVGGTFFIEATSRDISAQGDFKLSAIYAICDEVSAYLSPGQKVTGTLDSTDGTYGTYEGAYYDIHGLLLGDEGGGIRLTLEADSPSQALLLRDKGCNVIAEGEGRVTYSADSSGPYYIEVSGREVGSEGAYTLEVQ